MIIYQDRLGANIGKALKKDTFLQGRTGRTTPLLRHSYNVKTMILPTQARDKHGEITEREGGVRIGVVVGGDGRVRGGRHSTVQGVRRYGFVSVPVKPGTIYQDRLGTNRLKAQTNNNVCLHFTQLIGEINNRISQWADPLFLRCEKRHFLRCHLFI